MSASPASSEDHEPGQGSEEWEQLRRSVAMLPPGAWALRREEALRVLHLLVASRRRG